jgi:hypothetical protein
MIDNVVVAGSGQVGAVRHRRRGNAAGLIATFWRSWWLDGSRSSRGIGGDFAFRSGATKSSRIPAVLRR